MSDKVLLEFLEAPVSRRFEMALDDATAPVIAGYLGAEAFARYRELAAEHHDPGHLALAPPNLVFVPGVMGSLLHSEGRAGVWWIDARTRGHIDDLRLDPTGDDDANPGYKVRPFSIDTSYEPFLAAVQASPDLSHRFYAYDWRKSLLRSADGLRAMIKQAHEENGGQDVHLVGHSMGGLVIRATLMEHGDELWPIVGRVVFLGTPHYGSPAIAGYLKNHFWGLEMLVLLRRYLSRETFRSLYGVLELLPAPAGIYPGTTPPAGGGYDHPCVNFDLYDAGAWKLDLDGGQEAALQRVLDGARAFHERLQTHHAELDQDLRSRMAVIAGVGVKTLFRLAYRHGLARVWGEMEKVTDVQRGNPDRDGDGRVPLASARLPNVGDTRFVIGKHGDLPNLPPVIDAAFAWLRGKSMDLAATPEEADVAHLGVGAPAATGADADDAGIDPGYLALDDPADDALEQLDRDVEDGRRPDFVFVRPL
jgi:pimeloyl-ACP methyl ester carboxylesterase